MRAKANAGMVQIFTTFGLAIVMRGLAQFFFTPDYRSIPQSWLGGKTISIAGIFLPEPQLVRRGDGAVAPLAQARVSAMTDQHAFLQLGAEATVRVGDWVGLGLSHPCTVFDKWQLIPVVEGTTVVDLIRTYF